MKLISNGVYFDEGTEVENVTGYVWDCGFGESISEQVWVEKGCPKGIGRFKGLINGNMEEETCLTETLSLRKSRRVEVFNKQEGGRIVIFECPGCGYNHGLNIETNESHNWTFNNNEERPTLSPSILSKTGPWETGPKSGILEICHSFLKDGFLEFLDDCTHHLRGQTVELDLI